MTPRFYLRKPDKRSASGKSLIVLQVRFKKARYDWSTGETIDAKYWDKKRQRVKKIAATEKTGEFAINNTLNDYERAFRIEFHREGDKIPSPETMKRRMEAYEQVKAGGATNQETGPTFHSILQEHIDRIRKKGVAATIANQEAIQKHLVTLARTLNFESVTEDWWIDYEKALRNGDHSKDGRKCGGRTINNDLGVIRQIMDKAIDRGYTKNDEYLDFEVSDIDEPDGVALTPEEIETLFRLEFDMSNPTEVRWSEARDLLVLSCHTGLRWSDFNNISPDRIIRNGHGYDFKIRTTKTGKAVTVPAHPAILKIFDKYPNSPNRLPQGHKKRQFNDDVKNLCKQAKGFDALGLLESDPKKPLWQTVSSRTGRRSFCTNLFEMRDKGGISLMQIMEKTGHKTESAFFKYIKPRSSEASDALRRIHELDKDKY
jgi:hypothetical protein